MSRVADAYRRSRAQLTPGSGTEASIYAETWSAHELPWELGEPADLRPTAPVPPPGPSPAAAVTGPRRSGLRAQTALHEQVAPLVDRLLPAAAADAPPRSVLFARIEGDPQSAAVCAAAAEVLAGRTTGSVCVLDASLRSPGLHHCFGPVSARGLSDLLLEGGDIGLCLTNVGANLWVMPAGSRCADALRYLSTEQIHTHVTHLLSRFDYVLLDAAAAGLHRDVIVLGASVEAVVLVIDASTTRREVAKRTAETLQAARARLFGAVLTNRTFPIPEGIYRRL